MAAYIHFSPSSSMTVGPGKAISAHISGNTTKQLIESIPKNWRPHSPDDSRYRHSEGYAARCTTFEIFDDRKPPICWARVKYPSAEAE